MSLDFFTDATQFGADQIQEIEEGLLAGVDVELYAKPELLAIQMRQIRLGLADKLDVSCYASPDYDWAQMEEIRKGLLGGLDVSKYVAASIPFDVMHQIRRGLEEGIDLSDRRELEAGILRQLRLAATDGVDLSPYIDKGYTQEQLAQIWAAEAKGIELGDSISTAHRGAAIREIALGLAQKLDVSLYAAENMSWQQMREIRLGLEKRLDVDKYRSSLYSWQQMQQLRLGLEAGLETESYSSLMYTPAEMEKRRLSLMENRTHPAEPQKKQEYYDFYLAMDEDKMQAYLIFEQAQGKVSKAHILEALKEKNITYGIDYALLDELESKGMSGDMVVIARGLPPKKGENAWYEYFFEREVKKKPKLLPDGSVDYKNIKWFEIVSQNQRLACYHEAKEGECGYKVTGERIAGIKGEELLPITGRGFRLLPDKKTYISELNGKLEYENGRIEITNVAILGDINSADGNVEFNGSILIKGSIGEGVVVKAQGDILVEGYTEAALLEADGDVILKQGNNAGHKGHILAGRDVYGSFFENARIRAGGNIRANYFLNCHLDAKGSIDVTGSIGMLAGGEARAGRGVTTHDAGNDAAVRTYISIGREAEFKERRRQIEQEKLSLSRELMLLKNAYLEYQRRYTPEVRNANPLFLKIENAIAEKYKYTKALEQELTDIAQEEKKSRNVKLIAHGKIYQGVQVAINGAVWTPPHDIAGVTLKKKDGAVFIYRNV